MLSTSQMIALLRQDVVPALGCTEPACVALCAAHAARVLDGSVLTVNVQVSDGIYKNGMSAGIPHCDEVGLTYAAALGAVLANPQRGLEVFDAVDDLTCAAARSLVSAGSVSVALHEAAVGVFVECVIASEQGRARCRIEDGHTNVVLLEVNGVPQDIPEAGTAQATNHLVDELTSMTIAQMRQVVATARVDDLAFLLEGVEMNEALAAYASTHRTGVGIAESLRARTKGGLLGDTLPSRIMTSVASAAEGRLDGCSLPAMSSSGAGTKGLVVIIPIAETARAVSATRQAEIQALAFGHLVNRYINAKVGKLSPLCTCVMASSTAAAAAIAWLLGGTDQQIGHAIRNMTGTVTGMVCDGGKVGCALKVSLGSVAALTCALQAIDGVALRVTDGLCAATPEQCIENVARLGAVGMAPANAEILSIMARKQG